MTINDLLKMWADWTVLPCANLDYVAPKHPLARLMDGCFGGRPIYRSALPYGVAVDGEIAAKVEMAMGKLYAVYAKILRTEYLQSGEQDWKAYSLGLSLNAYRIKLSRAKNNLSLLLKDLLNQS